MAALSVDGTPMPALPNSADQINYDNTTSGLSATTVKGAVDELASEKQDATDNNLTTTDKTIVGGINELKSGLNDVNSNIASLDVTVDTMVTGGARTQLAANDTTEITLPTGMLFLYVIWRDSITYAQLGLIVYNWQGIPSVIEIAKPSDSKFTVTGASDNKISIANTGNFGFLSLRKLDVAE